MFSFIPLILFVSSLIYHLAYLVIVFSFITLILFVSSLTYHLALFCPLFGYCPDSSIVCFALFRSMVAHLHGHYYCCVVLISGHVCVCAASFRDHLCCYSIAFTIPGRVLASVFVISHAMAPPSIAMLTVPFCDNTSLSVSADSGSTCFQVITSEQAHV